MPDKFRRYKSHDERKSASYDETYRIEKVAPYGWDGSNMVQLKVDSDGNLQIEQSVATSATNSKVTIGTSTTVVLAADAARLSVTLVNDSIDDMYISTHASAVMNEGIRINASGGSLTLDKGSGCTLTVNAICLNGSKNLTVNTTS